MGFKMAEIELNVLWRQCLNRQVPKMTILKDEVAARRNELNRKNLDEGSNLQPKDAPIELQLYLSISD